MGVDLFPGTHFGDLFNEATYLLSGSRFFFKSVTLARTDTSLRLAYECGGCDQLADLIQALVAANANVTQELQDNMTGIVTSMIDP